VLLPCKLRQRNEESFFSLLFSSIDLRGERLSGLLPFDIDLLNNEGRTFLSLSCSASASA
jgi:hypothetical protein